MYANPMKAAIVANANAIAELVKWAISLAVDAGQILRAPYCCANW